MEGQEDEQDLSRLLAYLPEYGVVLCKECQFAIQPSAFSSHLQRHQIYRNERRRFLDRLAKLSLHSPDQVPIPPADIVPIENLPIYDGFKCNAPGCLYACTSLKRMNQHWSESHGQPDSRLIDSRPASLQTFFKGTKIRYFEVLCPPEHARRALAQPQKGAPSLSSEEDAVEQESGVLHRPSPRVGLETHSSPGLDIEALLYMQHFVLYPGRTVDRGTDPPDFWVNSIPVEAVKYPFLMYGILSMSAFHKAWTSADPDAVKRHQQAALQYQSAGLGGFREAVARPCRDSSTAIVAFSRLVGIQDCVQAQLEFLHDGPESVQNTSPVDIIESMVLLRGGVDLLLEMQRFLPDDSGFLLPERVLSGLQHPTRHYPRSSRLTSLGADGAIEACVFNMPAAVYDRLVSLPDKLAALDNLSSQDYQIILESVKLLIACVSQSHELRDNSTWPIWNGLESWVRSSTVQRGLFQLLEGGSPSALVVLAYWWLLIVRRLEQTHWFVRGMTEKIMHITMKLLGCSEAKDLLFELL